MNIKIGKKEKIMKLTNKQKINIGMIMIMIISGAILLTFKHIVAVLMFLICVCLTVLYNSFRREK